MREARRPNPVIGSREHKLDSLDRRNDQRRRVEREAAQQEDDATTEDQTEAE